MFRAHPKPWAGKKETRRFGRAFVAGGSISLFQPMLLPYCADMIILQHQYNAVNIDILSSGVESRID